MSDRKLLNAGADSPAPMNLTLAQAGAWLGAATLHGDGATRIARVHTDTRTLAPGDLFVALRGERFDGGQFLASAREAGAVAALCETGAADALRASGLPGLVVADARRALGELARGWRAQYALPLIAVTGSNGKTTVTQMLAAILRAWKGERALATRGNLNNDIGVPLTLLNLRPGHEAAVVELGMNHPGEMAWLAELAAPRIALVNNAQREHQEFMASVEAVAHENGSVIAALPADGVAVFPADDAHTGIWRTLAGQRQTLSFGEQEKASVLGLEAHWSHNAWRVQVRTPVGDATLALHIAGRHNVRNALAALACALAAGVPLATAVQGLAAFEPVAGRSRAFELPVGARRVTVIDDTYNANPDSVRALIDVLAELPAPRLLVLGDMGEVGEQGPAFHAEAGEHARACGIEHVFTHGELSRHSAAACPGARHFDDMPALVQAMRDALPQVRSVAVKGSRFMKMERAVQALQDAAQTAQEGGGDAA